MQLFYLPVCHSKPRASPKRRVAFTRSVLDGTVQQHPLFNRFRWLDIVLIKKIKQLFKVVLRKRSYDSTAFDVVEEVGGGAVGDVGGISSLLLTLLSLFIQSRSKI